MQNLNEIVDTLLGRSSMANDIESCELCKSELLSLAEQLDKLSGVSISIPQKTSSEVAVSLFQDFGDWKDEIVQLKESCELESRYLDDKIEELLDMMKHGSVEEQARADYFADQI